MPTYNELKKSPDGMPTNDALFPATLEIIAQHQTLKRNDLQVAVADSLNMSVELRNKMYENKDSKWRKPIIEHRVAWAITKLKQSGLIDYPRHGISEITPLGRELYEKHGWNLNEQILKNQPQFIEYKRLLNERKQRDGSVGQIAELEEADTSEEIEEIITNGAKNHRQVMATELLERIIKAEWIFFEHLVKELLIAMGYKGERGNAVVTKSSGDGGIDGIIHHDPLGTNTVYFQAKKYKVDNVVQRKDIQAFFGALSDIGASRGVFMTTSRFTKGAYETAERNSIVLIDGFTLTDLMLSYKVGVKIKDSILLYDIDEDFFEVD